MPKKPRSPAETSAAARVRRQFDALIAQFAATYPSQDYWPLVQLEFRKKHFAPDAGPRDCAWFEPDTLKIVMLRRVLRQEKMSTIIGLLSHELGHAFDCLQGTLDKPRAERRADIHAAAAGCPVFYDSRDIQNSLSGRPVRPAHLRK